MSFDIGAQGALEAIDVHAHHLPRQVLEIDQRFASSRDARGLEWLYFEGRRLGPLTPKLTDLGLMLEDQSNSRLTRRLCCTASWLTGYWADSKLGQRLSRTINEAIAEATRDHPGQLLGLATVPLQDSKLAIAELAYAVSELGLVGAAVGTNVNGAYFDDPRFDGFLEAAQELDVPLFFHPNDVAGWERQREYALIQLLGNPHEACLSLVRMILGGTLERFPRLKPCFPMGGGSVGLLLGRLSHGWRVREEARVKAPKPPEEYLDRIYFDTVLHSAKSLELVLEVISPDRLVLGTDYPWEMGQQGAVELIEHSRLSPDQRRAVLAGNAQRLLDRKLPLKV